MDRTARRVALIVGMAAPVAGALATPTFTTINNSSGEVSQAGLLHAVYGGSWSTLPDGRSLTNGALSAIRVADGGVGSPLNIVSGSATSADDKVWSGGLTTLVAKAKYAADTHTFGWFNDAPAPQGGSGFQSIFSTSNLNAPVTLTLSDTFRWALRDLATNQTLTSRDSDNPNGACDQMATYKITGLSSDPTWLIVWEDRTVNSDRDFNDAAIEIRAVPAPGALALAGVGAMLLGRRRR